MNDQKTFFLTVMNSLITAFLVGYEPIYASYWFCSKFLVAMGYRFLQWKKDRLHYFMTEFCYFANLVLISYFFLNRWGYYEENLDWGEPLFRVVFALANGPLAMGMLMLGDKLVFHDLQYSISLIIHMSPALLSWGIRWNSLDLDFPEAHQQEAELSWAQVSEDAWRNLSITLPVYGVWFLIYMTAIFGWLWDRIERKKNITMYSYLVRGRPNHPINWILKHIQHPQLKQVSYMLIHMLTIIPSLWLSGVWWNSFYAHTSLVFFLVASSIWHAGSYYHHKLLRHENIDRTQKNAEKKHQALADPTKQD